MKDDKNCAVFRDLYPSYLNEELEEETTDWMKNHLTECEGCRQWAEDCIQETEVDEEFKEEIEPQQNDEIKVMKRARIFLITGIAIVIALALWTSLWIVS